MVTIHPSTHQKVSNPMDIRVLDTVRYVHTMPMLGRVVGFGYVMSVQPSHELDNGTNGEPTITLGILNDAGQLVRVPTVRHVSHDEVQECAVEWCWTDLLGREGDVECLTSLNMNPTKAPAKSAPAPNTIGTVVYTNNVNGLEVFHSRAAGLVVSHSGDIHYFGDLFSAKTYVDAQKKEEDTDSNEIRVVDNGEDCAVDRFTVYENDEPVINFLNRESADQYVAEHKSKSKEAVQRVADALESTEPTWANRI